MMTCNLKKDKTLTEKEKYLDDAFTTAIVLSLVFQLGLFAYVDIVFYMIAHCFAVLFSITTILFPPPIKHYTRSKRGKIILFIFAPALSLLIIIAFFVHIKKPGIIADVFNASKKAKEIKRDNL